MQRLLLAAALALVPSLGFAGDETKTPKSLDEPKVLKIPFELIKTQHMVVNVMINDKGPYRLVFDTGAPDSLVNNKVAKEAGLFSKDTKRPLFALFGSMGQFKIKSLQLGDIKAENVPAMVLDHPTVEAIAKFVGPIEGILGFTFFSRYKMTIDYEKKEMTLVPTDFQPPDVMAAMLKRFTAPQKERDKAAVLSPAGLLGVRVAKDKDDMEDGVVVKEVLSDSPAAAAGIKAGDRLLTLDHRWTDSVNDCYIAAARMRPGVAATAVVLRDGKRMPLKVTMTSGL
jgi:hypothetical protein